MSLEILISLLISSLVCLIVWKLDPTKAKIFSFVCLPSHFILIFTLFNFEYVANTVSGANFTLTHKAYISTFFVEIGLIVSLVIFNFLSKKQMISKEKRELELNVIYSKKRLDVAILLCFVVSSVALLINLNRVGFNISLMLISARSYEATFGASWVVNYMYFLHIVTIFLLIIKKKIELRLSALCYIVGFISIAMSFLHGIKFTIFDAIFFPFFFYISLNGLSRMTKKVGLFLIVLFILIFALFSFLVRGGGDEINLLGFLNYISPNYINMFYLVERSEFFFAWPFDGFLELATKKLPIIRELPAVGFHLNDSYNMITGFPFLLGYFSYVGVFFYYLVCIVLIKIAENSTKLISHFVSAYVMFSLFMFLYAYYLGTKPKYIYLFLVMLVANFILKSKKDLTKK
ncbi:oligosaccharide repeat unit polymerase [Ascidiaceihabitans sp.]|nr:oligosaccharide repeat unit polymerase [Ascidiaceihabitans sp.]